MRGRAARVVVGVLAIAVFFAAQVPAAYAGETDPSTVAQIKLVAPGDELYKLYQGALWLNVDKASHNYKWGGRQCGSITLTDAQVLLLINAFDNKHTVVLDFEENVYKGRSYRCISAIAVRR